MNLFIRTFLFITILGLISCSAEGDAAAPQADDTGVAGSYARFLVVGEFMYIVDETSIKTFNVSAPAEPEQVDQQTIGDRIESIFRFEDKLFIGSGGGLFIYQIGTDGIPIPISATEYFSTFDTFACDPVVANDSFAYVTLNSLEQVNRPCGGTVLVDVNVLKIYNIENIQDPFLVAEYPMHAPKGVGLDGEVLFVCDHDHGLKIFDVSDPLHIRLIRQFSDFTAFDVIPLDGLLLVVGPENVYQFDYRDLTDIKLMSQIPYGV